MPSPISDRDACRKYRFTAGWLKQHRLDGIVNDRPKLPTRYHVAGKVYRDDTGPDSWETYLTSLKKLAAAQEAKEHAAIMPLQPPKRPRGRPRK